MRKNVMEIAHSTIKKDFASSCFFRSSVSPPYRKAVIRITDICNARCVHCFISADNHGETMSLKNFRGLVLPQLLECNVSRVTLTGGEPFLHPNILEIIHLLADSGIRTGICTNANVISEKQIQDLAESHNVHINVSLHGFTAESHDRFMGKRGAFDACIKTIEKLSKYNLVQGFLVTPNAFAEVREYENLCVFAIQNKAKYILMNPLSSMGRGYDAIQKYAASEEKLQTIRKTIQKFSDRIQLVFIRFPNENLPLGACEAGNIFYIFVNGDVTVCAYLVFAANTPGSRYKPKDFILGNLFHEANIAQKLKTFQIPDKDKIGQNETCKSCKKNIICGKGCPSAVIYSGKMVGAIDAEVCPYVG
jgi:radical SAM protein with 4Fe4S-binding SPASM domain